MSIDRETDESGGLQIGATELGMVRIYVVGDGFDLPMDFDPDEAREIGEEILAAAERAADIAERARGRSRSKAQAGAPQKPRKKPRS